MIEQGNIFSPSMYRGFDGCEHPIKIVRDGQVHFVNCGRCAYCLRKRMQKWQHFSDLCGKKAYNQVIFLSYSNKFIPRGYLENDGDNSYLCPCVSIRPWRKKTLKKTYVNETQEISRIVSDLDERYKIKRFGSRFIGLLSKNDLRNFFKRLRERISRELGYSANIVFTACGEYGPTTFRPHYHIFVSSDDKAAIALIPRVLSDVWKLGTSDCQPSRGGISQYVSQYLSCMAHLPDVLQCFNYTKPFFCHSNGLQKNLDDYLPSGEIPTYRSIREVIASGSHPDAFALLQSDYIRTLYPRCFRYDFLDDVSFTQVYSIYRYYLRFRQSPTESLLHFCRRIVWIYHHGDLSTDKMIDRGIYLPTIIYNVMRFVGIEIKEYDDNYYLYQFEKDVNRLYSVFLCSRTCYVRSVHYGVPMLSYINSLRNFWYDYDRYNLSQFVKELLFFVDSAYPDKVTMANYVVGGLTDDYSSLPEVQKSARYYRTYVDNSYKKAKTTEQIWLNRKKYSHNFKSIHYE